MNKSDAKIVVIGGGTGSFMLLSGLKKYFSDITALVAMADDGGSSGELRDELGVLPPGDARQCLVALSKYPKVRDLFNYRFEEGGLKGHAFGNLFISALEKMNGSFAEAIEVASKVLNIDGKVMPITLDSVILKVDDGVKVIAHEKSIRQAKFANLRPKVWLEPTPTANPEAVKAIEDADLVIIAPGGLYESLGAALTVSGVGQALAATRAKKIYICNLMNQENHTDHFAVHDYAAELERLAGAQFLTYVIYNQRHPDESLLKRYAAKDESLVLIDEGELGRAHYTAVGANLLSDIAFASDASDKLASQRSLIRHDPDRVAAQILKVGES